jgi:hypothetical protein
VVAGSPHATTTGLIEEYEKQRGVKPRKLCSSSSSSFGESGLAGRSTALYDGVLKGREGNKKWWKMLAESRANIEAYDRTALLSAAERAYEKVGEMMLDRANI